MLVQARSLIPIGLILSGLFLGWGTTSLYFTAKIDRSKAMLAKEEARIAEATRQAHEIAVQKQNQNEAKRDKEKANAKRETDNLRTKYLNDSISLRVKGVSTTPTDSSSSATGTCTLDTSAGEAYFALRYAISELESDYDLCIDTLKSDRGIHD